MDRGPISIEPYDRRKGHVLIIIKCESWFSHAASSLQTFLPIRLCPLIDSALCALDTLLRLSTQIVAH